MSPSSNTLLPKVSAPEDDLITLARADFATFFELLFPVLHNGNLVVWADYLDLLTHVLERAAGRHRRRVLMNLPPGHLKSMLVSVYYVAWRLGQDPTLQFICISYGDDLTHLLSSRTRHLMQSSLYKKVFPKTILTKKAQDHLETTKGGYRYATAVGSDITGFRADEIIIDDPLQPQDAMAGLAKEKVMAWIQNSVLTRFRQPSEGVMILVMHRLAPDDPSGVLQEQAGWLTIELPLVAEAGRSNKYERGKTKEIIYSRKAGDILNPNRMTADDIAQLKREIPSHVYAAQYQQRPIEGSTGMCSIDRFQRYVKAPPFDLTIHSWDIAITAEGNYTVCTKWGVAKGPQGDVMYLVNVVRIRMESPDVREAILMHNKLDKPDMIVIDSGGAGLGILQDLWRQGLRHVHAASDIPDNSQSRAKIERFSTALLCIYDGKVLFPAHAPFMDPFLAEFASFPNGKYLDQVDSVTQLVSVFERAIWLAGQKRRLGR